MAEESSVYELEGLEKQLQSLVSRYSSDELRGDSEPFCSDFCKLVEEYASRWQVPLPQLRILEIALCYFAQASTFFTSNCDHVLHTLSSLALSLFELLLFFDQKDFHQEPLKHLTVTFQECHLTLAKHQNVHLLQVERLVQGGGPWASPALQAILSESSLPQNEVDGCISSELPVFFELRVRYLLSCERVSEAMALAKCCAQHSTAGQHLFFLQVYLTWLHKISQHDLLHKEVADFNGKDAVHIICSLECEEKDELLLALSTAFLLQQLRRGDMYYLCDLVFVWTKLHSRLKTSEPALLEEIHQLMLSATNVNSIFPFIRAIMQEVGEDGIQFCVELCANALGSCLPCDVLTKSLIYKTIAGLLPNDLEVCRACALLVFFLERTVESYKIVYLLYMHPDQEYHVDHSPIGNHVRFETLQVLKKDLYFDPEFWNLIALRTNCLKLMSEKVVSAALEEIMEDKWISNYCAKESASGCHKGRRNAHQAAAKKRHHKEDTDTASKRLKVGAGKAPLNVDVKKKGSRPLKEGSSEPLRRSFWRLDRLQDNVAIGYGEHRRITRLSEKNPPKRRIRTPKWLLDDSGTLEENNGLVKIKKHGLRHEKLHQSSVLKRSDTGQIKNNVKHKQSVNSHLKARDNNKDQRGFSLESAATPQVILELSLPDNELMGTFHDDACHRHRGLPQVLLYRPTVKIPATSQPVRTVHRKEVVLRARDVVMFVQQLHCYARRPKGKGNGLNVHGSVSTITRSSVQGSPPKDLPKEVCDKPATDMKGEIVTWTTATAKDTNPPILEGVLQAQTEAVSPKTSSARELYEKSDVEMKVTVASPALHKIPQAQSTGKVSQSLTLARELSKKSAPEMELTTESQTSAAAEVTDVPQARTVASAGEPCEEPAVEMKVTIASQSPVSDKVSKAATAEGISKAEAPQTSTADKNQKKGTQEIPPVSDKANVSNTGAADPAVSQSQHIAHRGGKQDLKSLSCQAETGRNSIAVSMPEMDVAKVSSKDSKGYVPFKNDTSPGRTVVAVSKASETEASYTPTDQGSISDISALTLVTEMVTELPPERLARDLENDKQRAPDSSASRESSVGSTPKVPHKKQSTSSCSVPEQEASVDDVLGKKEKERSQDVSSDTPENSEFMETQPESEESKLEYCCTFCNKEFKGSRVVAHAMFHYRKDECMFCGTMFKDDLLAMMHLSDHIEKLKRIKDLAGNKAQENGVSDTKDISTPKTSAKAMTTNMSSGCWSKRRLRKSTLCAKSLRPRESRKLRSNDKSADDPSLQGNQKTLKHLNSKTAVHKVNGHIGKKKDVNRSKKESDAKQKSSQVRRGDGTVNPGLQVNRDVEIDSSAASGQVDRESACSTEKTKNETESLQGLKTATKQNEGVVEEKNVLPQEKICCPVEGCSWLTDLSKNRVAVLYHAIDDHYGEIKPLELAFSVGNSRCSICMRVLWSFEHFQHHVERHRLTPRHPCLHQGCAARFKTGMEMRRHARKHSPLQAVCCLPGCSQLFICLWALNLHEREHYTSKSTKPDKNTNVQTDDKPNTPAGTKQQDQSSEDTAPTTVNKAARKLRDHATHDSPTRKHAEAPPLSAGRPSLIKEELKERNESKDSNVLKNLSNKNTSAQPTVPNLRLRQTLRKVQVTSATMNKVISSSLLKHGSRVRHKLKKKLVKANTKRPKRRGRPPKPNKAVHDENTTAGQSSEAALQKDQNTPAQPPPPETVETASASNKLEVEEEESQQVQDVVKTAEESNDESESKKSAGQQIKRNHFKQKGISHNASPSNSLKRATEVKTQKSAAVKIQKLHKSKNRSAPSDSSKSKKHKVANGNNKKTEKNRPNQEPDIPSTSKKPAKSKPAVPQAKAKLAAVVAEGSADDEGKAKVENSESTQPGPGESVISVPANGSATDRMKEVKTQVKSKKVLVTKEGKSTHTASSNSSKKQKHVNEKGEKKSVKEKHPGKASASSKSEAEQQDEAEEAAAVVKSSPDVEGNVKEEALDAALDGSGPSMPANIVNEKACPPTVPKENRPTGAKKEKSKKNLDPSKAHKKRKDTRKEDDTKVVKKQCKDQSVPSKKPAKSPTEVQPLTEAKAEAGESSVAEGRAEMPPSTISGPGYTLIMNGQASSEDVKSTVCKETLAEYGKKPYMRLPPTAYLDEKYITMPKRRKDMMSFQPSHRSPPAEQACATAALQRQRCANCFASFNSAEELQSHVQLQRCSNLFGFDSDDEGNS